MFNFSKYTDKDRVEVLSKYGNCLWVDRSGSVRKYSGTSNPETNEPIWRTSRNQAIDDLIDRARSNGWDNE